MDVYKLLIVGEPKTGKTQLITSFLSVDSKFERESRRTNVKATFLSHQNSMIGNNNQKTLLSTHNNTKDPNLMLDFVMKIIEVDGRKVRLQLWEIAGGSKVETAFCPLFIRNAVGCIILANADNPKSIKAIGKWKQKFEEATTFPSQNPLPTAVFMNHVTKDSSQFELNMNQLNNNRNNSESTYDITNSGSTRTISLTPKLKAQCEQIQQTMQVPIYHLNSMMGDNILESFQQFMGPLIKDLETNLMRSIVLDDLMSQNNSIRNHISHNNKNQNQDSMKQNLNLSNNRYPHGKGGHISGYDRTSVQLDAKKMDKSQKDKKGSCKC